MTYIQTKHLSKDQIDAIFNRWYLGEKTNSLLNEFEIEKINGRSFSKHFSPIITEDFCPYCFDKLFAFRSDPAKYKKYKVFYDLSTAHCINCGHVCQKANCKCQGCILERVETERLASEKEAQRLFERAVHLERLYDNIEPINTNEIKLLELIYFYGLCYQSTCEDVTLISPLSICETSFTPSHEWDRDCIQLLLKYISPVCDDDKLLTINEKGHARWSGRQVFYRIKIEYQDQSDYLEHMLSCIKARLNSASFEEKFEFASLCGKLMICECTDYLEFMRTSLGLPHEIGVKTTALFKKLIKNWRIDQIYTVIWKCCKDVLAYQFQNGLPKKHASNMVIGSIDKYIDKVIKNGWSIKPYYRDRNKKQSVMSYVIFNKVLEFGGFGIEYNFQDVLTKLGMYTEQPEETTLVRIVN